MSGDPGRAAETVRSPDAPRLLPCGRRAVLVEVADLDAVLALDARLRARIERAQDAVWASVEDLVPAARTLLVTLSADGHAALLRDALRRELAASADPQPPEQPAGRPAAGTLDADAAGRVVEIRVRYDGPDLDEVARLTGLSRQQVVRAHTAARWRVAFGGFAPGFAYLCGDDPRLEVPRRDSPRTKVPTGSVGLAGEFSGVYPRSSPGGWQLIGRTDTVLWDTDRDPPALLRPGWSVRFVDVTADGPDLEKRRSHG